MGTQGVNGNNQNDPLWQEAKKIASQWDSEDGADQYIGKNIWEKHRGEYGLNKIGSRISVDRAAELIHEKKVLESIRNFSTDGMPNMDELVLKQEEPVQIEEPPRKEVIVEQAPKEVKDTSFKHKAVDFNKFFKSDGPLSYDEVKEQVAKTNNMDTLKRIAAELGVRTSRSDDATEYPVNIIKNYINRSIDILKEADKDEDMSVSDNELKEFDKKNSYSYNKFSEAGNTVDKRERLNEILGMIDGKYNNEQGVIMDAWLLSAGQSISENPDLYNQIFKKDDNGVTITFFGIEGSDGKPYSKRISNKQIQKQHAINVAARNSGDRGYGSLDPDAIALELAYPSAMAQNEINGIKEDVGTRTPTNEERANYRSAMRQRDNTHIGKAPDSINQPKTTEAALKDLTDGLQSKTRDISGLTPEIMKDVKDGKMRIGIRFDDTKWREGNAGYYVQSMSENGKKVTLVDPTTSRSFEIPIKELEKLNAKMTPFVLPQ